MTQADASPLAFSPRALARQRRAAALASFWHAFRRDRLAMLGLVVLLGFVVLAMIAPWISPKSGLSVTASASNPRWASPSWDFPLGTDHNSRSGAAQFVWGSRVSIFVGLVATVLTIAIGSFVGIVAGFFGRWTDAILMRLTDWFLVIPFLPLAIVLAAVLERSLRNIVVVIAITSWPGTARLVRAQVLTVKQRLFVDRARALGATRAHVIRRHILPNVAPLILANVTLAVPISILTETTLSFLGLGDPNRTSWGKVLEQAQSEGAVLRNAWWYYLPSGIGIVVVVLAFTLVGRAIEEILDPRLREQAS